MTEHGGSTTCADPAAGAAVAVALLAMSSSVGPFVSVAFAAQPKGQVLDVVVNASRVSLVAREAPLADVLAAICRQAGVKVVLRDALSTSVTATLVNVPLEEAIQRLSRCHSIALIYDRSLSGPEDSALTEVWLRSPYPEAAGCYPRQAELAPGVSPDPQGDTAPPSPVAPPPTELARWAQALLALKDTSPEILSRQLDALVRAHGSHAIVAALREVAVGDPSPRSRRGAIQVLALIGSPKAIEAIRATLADVHPSVRSEAQTALRRHRRAHTDNGPGV